MYAHGTRNPRDDRHCGGIEDDPGRLDPVGIEGVALPAPVLESAEARSSILRRLPRYDSQYRRKWSWRRWVPVVGTSGGGTSKYQA